ncbi:MAG TPA: hypothetical protein PLR06_13905, partial [Cyclobacteriaceae bacterium]|nr:hypothetical protein [Cyclobacteriaceae bacterium]
MKNPEHLESNTQEGLDIDKLRVLLRKNIWIVILIFVSTNLVAYLTIRWTKDIYEARAELKLEIKEDATALGIKQLADENNRNVIAGEMEQMKSKLFFSRVLDSLDLWISYYNIGNVLEFEMYRSSPFRIEYKFENKRHFDQRIYFDFQDNNKYLIK